MLGNMSGFMIFLLSCAESKKIIIDTAGIDNTFEDNDGDALSMKRIVMTTTPIPTPLAHFRCIAATPLQPTDACSQQVLVVKHYPMDS